MFVGPPFRAMCAERMGSISANDDLLGISSTSVIFLIFTTYIQKMHI